MAIPTAIAEPMADDDDNAAIGHLRAAFEAQREAFARDRCPSLAERRQRLQALIAMMAANRARIAKACADDFGSHPQGASDLIEVLGVIGRAAYVLEHLDEWMRPSHRNIDQATFGTATAEIRYQPKGVVGNIVPWNFPFDLAVGPMIDMLAAGNRVIVKPSEYTPASAALLAEMFASAFDSTLVHVAVGGVALARAFSATPFDHLLYTGSPAVGREVMAAAARNLTPVTLELGGKCPAIMAPGSVTRRNVEQVLVTKMIKNGQMCVTVDYVLAPRAELDAFVGHARAFIADTVPAYSRTDDCTGIISKRHFDRLQAMLAQAMASDARVVSLEANGVSDRTTRRMPISLVLNPAKDSALMRDEIFGPILPIVPYDDLDDAVASVNAGERPLALYVFSDEPALAEDVLARTHSGGAAVNACGAQGGLPSMGFGGSGNSGIGRHHGIEGFREFSNARGVFIRGESDNFEGIMAPYSRAVAIVDAALGSSTR